jgi:hypothetical protein
MGKRSTGNSRSWLGCLKEFYPDYSFSFKFSFKIQNAANSKGVWRSKTPRHFATSRKLAGSIPDEIIGFFNCPNPSSRTMTPGIDSVSNRNGYKESSWG